MPTPSANTPPPQQTESTENLEIFDEACPLHFVEINRQNNREIYRAGRIQFQFRVYEIWVVSPPGELPTPEDLKAKDGQIQCYLDWHMRKHLFVFGNDAHVSRVILEACPEIITSSIFFSKLRQKTKANFRSRKSTHLYVAFYVRFPPTISLMNRARR